jgi:hypothetical protein
VLAPSVALLTFPHRAARPSTWLHSRLEDLLLGSLVPNYGAEPLPTDCMGNPYGPVAGTQLLFALASDVLLLSLALGALSSLLLLRAATNEPRRPRPQPLGAWSLLIATAAVFAWATLWLRGLSAVT